MSVKILRIQLVMVSKYLSLIKFSHTVFAMPFALIGFTAGVFDGAQPFNFYSLVYVILCMIFARSAAMAFNRYLDRDYDAQNVRTAIREIPKGVISPQNALLFTLIMSVLFILTTLFINRLCFYLSFVALAVILGYSYTKRFTPLCHIVLGIGLGLAPVGAYIAVTEVFTVGIILLGLAVVFWVSGFDIIYALQDAEFDKTHQLHSIPVLLGKNRALILSRIIHVLSVIFLSGFVWLEQGSFIMWGAVAFFATLLVIQHRLVKPNDLSKITLAFFTTNGVAAVIVGFLVILDFVIFRK